MRLPYFIAVLLIFLVSAGLSLVAASYAVTKIEETSEFAVRRSLDLKGHDWAEVESDGLRVVLTGTAPDEATRFNALTAAGTEVETSRVIDEMEVEATSALAPPRFSAEILRNDSGISIIGLIPASEDREELIDRLRNLDRSVAVSDLMETADYPKPDGWDAAISYAIEALARLPRAKVSASSGLVKITAIADSQEEKQRLEQDLTRTAPPSLRIGLAISAPRPVITPFTLRYLINDEGGQFDACSAQDEKARDRIVAAARDASLQGTYSCTIGLGEPSPRWPEAAELSIQALSKIGNGTVTLSDADITLVAAQGTDPALFDRVVGELETALPPVFALHAVLPEPEDTDSSGPVEFSATRSPEGLVQLRGRLGDETLRDMVDSYARAAFGSDQVYTATRIVTDLPSDWPVRVLAGLEALAQLHNGAVTVTPDTVELTGLSHEEDAKARIAGQLSDKLGEGQEFTLMITYQPPPEPEDALPDPEVCEQQIAEVQAASKIAFEPGSTTIASDSRDTVNQIADILRDCGPIRLEIQGHTDSQGREEMNQQLSQARAQSILNELRGRRIPTSSYTAVGYGETQPIADNDTEEGREENRRIEFRLIRPEPVEANETGLEALETETDTSEADQTDTTASDADAEDQ
ncbi:MULTISPECIES: OmpA family protein [unclassified Ruegeria]|uniref:OmpA family protein n=1 Tax=unclassified Ruegeria TaxID=2625375 RepID=UPI0014878214|nr:MULTISPECIES: OmpA family protein [unclassified Ruegeria]NOD76464.1 OmpA family protein [Ruegeria sp. HKCCD4332]NOD89184.1 OmpA family protein [Ruegeria sp. HKCCD4318]NOE13653.1 OmpA family protein [Ruegeria sp. HKCCD4318-2]NOG07596.1 OmpA family protein [Ruegeria sp. HKCCD4315]